ncbi:elongation of very long chain fatty acids protein AAEL008004-like [Limulus polyphemus]|uniref:Elongation of very long chain fatty acids protein n=1 Tax=Limulus polyphemus TaxID=6850 RepID=A0ABM1BEB9_LIMPO|nr:elongation of very long chain fatty acids protein AAEL008004-like [Limulus polyphemus]
MDLLNDMKDWYNHTLENGDARVQGWMFMQGPGSTVTICLSYVYFVKVLGPFLMKNRRPLVLHRVMLLYNFVMVFASIYLFYKLGILGWFGKYSYTCQPVDYSDNPDATEMVHITWWYYISKFVEFSDTIFFVLRKKFSHISTLHVIHHGVMPISVWWGVKFTPGGHSTFFAFVNSFVHIIMYIYYGLAAAGPQMQKYLWWKKYMTTIQMIQFIAIFLHAFQLLFRECDYPKGFMWFIGFHAVLFWFLFWDFYKKAYKKPGSRFKKCENDSCDESLKSNNIRNTNGVHKKEMKIHENGANTKNGIKVMKEA